MAVSSFRQNNGMDKADEARFDDLLGSAFLGLEFAMVIPTATRTKRAINAPAKGSYVFLQKLKAAHIGSHFLSCALAVVGTLGSGQWMNCKVGET